MTRRNANPKPKADSDARQSTAEAALRRVLKTAPQDLWLDTIRRTRGQTHNQLIFWMLSQTECDFAVAVHAFYRSDPGYHLDNPKALSPRPGPDDIFDLALLNWDKGYYRAHKLQLGQRDIHHRTLARINQKAMARPRGSLPFNIPARFLQPDGGAPLALPPHLNPDNAAHLWSLYNTLGLHVPSAAPGLSRRMAKAKNVLNMMSFRTRRS